MFTFRGPLYICYCNTYAIGHNNVLFICRAVESLGGKNLVMNLVNHGSSDVRMQALLAIQKMMVQNW